MKSKNSLLLPKAITYRVNLAALSHAGTLIINVLQRNDGPPEFDSPWTPDEPYIDLTVREEQPVGTHVTILVASGPTDAVSNYRLISNPGGYFSLDQATGIVGSAVDS